MITLKIIIACTNAQGQSDLFVHTVETPNNRPITQAQIDRAKEQAEKSGFTGPFVCFSGDEQKHIVKVVSELDCPVPFKLEDKAFKDSENHIEGLLQFGWDGVSVSLQGYSDMTSEDNQGIVGYVEFWGGTANLRAYGDINSEEPTHVISLEGARNELRVED